jgi:hypothetical protein
MGRDGKLYPTTRTPQAKVEVCTTVVSPAPRPHDVRPTVAPDVVLAALLKGADAIRAELGDKPRFRDTAWWPAHRQAFHTLPDDARREAIIRLVLEQVDRDAADAGLSMNRAG